MTFTFKPAARENVHVMIALAAASGGGKTKTALELAVGLAGGDESRIAMVDTEARRGLHYARRPGASAKDEPDRYGFQHADMLPPFRPERIVEAVRAADEAGMKVLIIDSMSHEYDGEGGIMDMATELENGTPKPGIENPRDPWSSDGWQDWAKKPVKSPGNWKEPKLAHKRMMNSLLEARCHIIFCLRAEEKIAIYNRGDMLPDGSKASKTTILPRGWVPIAEKRFMYEMTLSFTLRPDQPGVPQFDLDHKLQDQHRAFFPPGEFISREAGRRLADWAAGVAPPAADPIAVYAREVRDRIAKATTSAPLLDWWKATKAERDGLSIPAERADAMAAAVTKRVDELNQQQEPTNG